MPLRDHALCTEMPSVGADSDAPADSRHHSPHAHTPAPAHPPSHHHAHAPAPAHPPSHHHAHAPAPAHPPSHHHAHAPAPAMPPSHHHHHSPAPAPAPMMMSPSLAPAPALATALADLPAITLPGLSSEPWNVSQSVFADLSRPWRRAGHICAAVSALLTDCSMSLPECEVRSLY